jgi:hypothetical protein
MKKLIAILAALSVVVATAAPAAAYPHRHRVCHWRHGHKICHWAH